jgi:hypothetical protein
MSIDPKTLILTIAIFVFGLIALVGAFKNMVKGFSPYNMKILGIILVATFSSLLAINHEDGMTSAMGILGAIVGYLFGINDQPKNSA